MIRVSELDVIRFPAGETSLKDEPHDNTVLLDVPTAEGIMTMLQYAQRIGGIHAIIAYLPYARADKAWAMDIRILVNMLATAEGIAHLTVIDPHSDISRALLAANFDPEYFTIVEATDVLVGFDTSKYTAVVAPDKGAVRRAGSIAKLANLLLVTASKVRDQETGWITSYELNNDNNVDLSNVLVIDDICDGGATFSVLRGNLPGDADLYVSHGVFSGKARDNLKGYGRVITTDSLTTAGNLENAEIIRVDSIDLVHHAVV